MTARTTVLVDVDGVINAMPDGTADLDHWPADSWRRDRIHMPGFGQALEIHWSQCVVDGLRLIEAMPAVEMVWCTTWKQRAPELLSPHIGIGADWPHVDEIQRDPTGRWFDWWKATRAYEVIARGDRVVWIDDDIAPWLRILAMAGRDDERDWTARDEAHCVSPVTRRGLEPSHFDSIERYLRS